MAKLELFTVVTFPLTSQNLFSATLRRRQFRVVRWGEYHAAQRYDPSAHTRDFTDIFELEYARLPGYENISKKEYVRHMLEKLHAREQEIVRARLQAGKGFVGRENLLKAPRGVLPLHSKTSTRYQHRPRVLCVCPERRKQYRKWYFGMYRAYCTASQQYRAGDLTVVFPDGTYRPFLKTGPPQDSEGVEAFA